MRILLWAALAALSAAVVRFGDIAAAQESGVLPSDDVAQALFAAADNAPDAAPSRQNAEGTPVGVAEVSAAIDHAFRGQHLRLEPLEIRRIALNAPASGGKREVIIIEAESEMALTDSAVFLSDQAPDGEESEIDDDAAFDAEAEDAAGLAPDASLPEIFARDSFKLTPIVCPFKGKIKYKPGEVSCGLLSVPENRARPRSRKIQLHYVKLAARQPDKWDAATRGERKKRDDAIIYLTGGPGVHASSYVKRLKDNGARDVRDLYILEQRGIGNSGDFCPLFFNIDPAASNVSDWESYQRSRLGYIEACFAAARARGVDLAGYNSIENARDVHALRLALGIDKWNVWGISYGSILGQAYLKEDPQGIRAAVIEAVVPLIQGAHFQKIGTFLQRDLDLLEKACAENEICAANFPDIDGRLKEAMKAVEASPIEIDAIDAELFPNGKAWFFHDLIGALPFSALYEEKNYATLPAMIDALANMVERKDWSALRVLTAGGPGGFDLEISQGMYNAIACNDNWVGHLRQALEEDQAAYPLFGSLQGDPALADEMVRICKKYGMAPRPAEEYAPVETDIRSLIVVGSMDPVTPPELAKMIVPGFSNGTYVEYAYAGHGPNRSVKCGGEFLTRFFDAPDGKLDTTCPDGMKPPKFTGPLFETQGHLRLVGLAAEDEKKAVLPFLWIGLAGGLLVCGALLYSIAPLARLLNREPAASTHGARALAWATSVAGSAAVIGIGVGAAMTAKAGETLLLVGFLGWTRWFVWAGLAAGILGSLLLLATFRARRQSSMPIGVLTGLLVTGLSGVALAAFLLVWDFAPL